jgi:glycosyltransferase involved in cell wall biosynthesis
VPRLRSLRHAFTALTWMSQVPCDVTRIGLRCYLAKMLATINHVLREEQIDIIYSPFAYPALTAGLPAARAQGVPVVVSVRGADVFMEESAEYGSTRDPRQRKIISSSLRHADHVIGVSRALVSRAVELGANESNTTVILKGVDETRFVTGDTRLARKKVNLPNRPTILYVGRLHPVKGLVCLMDAFKRVAQVIDEVQLVVCGDGSQKNLLKSIASENGLLSQIHFVGNVGRDSITHYFQACDVFVLPSLSEGSGNVLVEAAACAKPSIGANVGGIPDYIENGVTGLLFPKADAQELASKAIDILSAPDKARLMGQAARKQVEMRHRYGYMLDHLEAVLRQVVGRSRVRTPMSAAV